jgi:hypothetical protein
MGKEKYIVMEHTDYERFYVDVRELVDWKNPPTIEQLKADYQEALAYHSKHVSRVNKWLSALDGEPTKPFVRREGRSEVKPKLIRKQAEWRYSALEEPFLSTDDMFTVNPVTALDKEAAYQNELILNKQFRVDIDKVKFIGKYVRTAVNTGTVVLKLGWKVEEGQVREEIEVPVYATPEESLAILQQQVQEGAISAEIAQQMFQAGEPIQLGTELQEQTVVKEIVNCPVIEIRDSRMVIIDPSCEGDINKAQFIIDRFTTDLSSLKKDGRYKNLDRIRPTDHAPIYEPEPLLDNNDNTYFFKDKPRQKMMVYEYWGYWDIHKDGIVRPIVAAYVGDTMIRLQENPFPDKKLPFVIVQYIPLDNTVYGESDAALLMDNQDIIGALMRGMLDLLGRSANAQVAIRKDALDIINMAKYKRFDDYEVNPHIQDLEKAFYINKYPEIPQSALTLLALQNDEAEALTGVKSFASGINGNSLGDTVGGIRSALDATAKRELGILRRLSNGLIEVAKKIVAMNSVFLSDEEVVRITDEEFVAIKRDDLAGNFDLAFTVSTADSDNQKAGELAFMLQTTGNSLPFDITKLLLVEIARLRKMPELAKAIQTYEPQPSPLEQEKLQLEVELLKAQVANEQSKANENAVDVYLKEAKTQTELAKARNIESTADMTDLDYIEKSSGISHDREIETALAKTKPNPLQQNPLQQEVVQQTPLQQEVVPQEPFLQ